MNGEQWFEKLIKTYIQYCQNKPTVIFVGMGSGESKDFVPPNYLEELRTRWTDEKLYYVFSELDLSLHGDFPLSQNPTIKKGDKHDSGTIIIDTEAGRKVTIDYATNGELFFSIYARDSVTRIFLQRFDAEWISPVTIFQIFDQADKRFILKKELYGEYQSLSTLSVLPREKAKNQLSEINSVGIGQVYGHYYAGCKETLMAYILRTYQSDNGITVCNYGTDDSGDARGFKGYAEVENQNYMVMFPFKHRLLENAREPNNFNKVINSLMNDTLLHVDDDISCRKDDPKKPIFFAYPESYLAGYQPNPYERIAYPTRPITISNHHIPDYSNTQGLEDPMKLPGDITYVLTQKEK